MRKILIVVAHPDDEVIFFWWALQNPEWKCSILCCSSDVDNPLRKKWARRKEGLFALCNSLAIECECLDYGSEFYKLDGRSGEFAAFGRDVLGSIADFEFDAIATHNLWGEYGHLDHVLLHYIVAAAYSVMTSDIFIPDEWSPHDRIESTAAFGFKNDLDKYYQCKKLYDDIRCWTWNREPIEVCGVIENGH